MWGKKEIRETSEAPFPFYAVKSAMALKTIVGIRGSIYTTPKKN